MNKELARELKDAGFPQQGKGKWLSPFVEDGILISYFESDTYEPSEEGDDSYYVPTLEELIEACSPYFWHLICVAGISRGDVVIQRGGWIADARIDNITATGDTSLEAVARLWLSMNKKP